MVLYEMEGHPPWIALETDLRESLHAMLAVNGVLSPKIKIILFNFAFCFPDVYEVGMSHLGSRILYGLLNQKSIWCERVLTVD